MCVWATLCGCKLEDGLSQLMCSGNYGLKRKVVESVLYFAGKWLNINLLNLNYQAIGNHLDVLVNWISASPWGKNCHVNVNREMLR